MNTGFHIYTGSYHIQKHLFLICLDTFPYKVHHRFATCPLLTVPVAQGKRLLCTLIGASARDGHLGEFVP